MYSRTPLPTGAESLRLARNQKSGLTAVIAWPPVSLRFNLHTARWAMRCPSSSRR